LLKKVGEKMSYDVGELVANIDVDVSGILDGMNKATATLTKFGSTFDGIAEAITKNTTQMERGFDKVENSFIDGAIGIIASVEKVSTQLDTMSKHLVNTERQSKKATQDMSNGFEYLGDVIIECFKDLSVQLSGVFEKMIAKVVDVRRQTTNQFKAMRKEVDSELNGVKKSVENLNNTSAKLKVAVDTKQPNTTYNITNVKGAATYADQYANAMARASKHTYDNSWHAESLMGKLRVASLNAYILSYNLQMAASMFENVFGAGIKFNAEMENTKLGIAGILASMGKIDGNAITMNDALQLSQNTMEQLSIAALTTTSTTSELVAAYQALLAPGLRAKMNMQEILDLTVAGTNAVKALGLPKQQVIQELRDLVAGGITSASSTLATSLGLKDKDIEAAKNSADGLYKFLMDKLKGFAQMGEMTNSTWTGIISNIQDGLERVMGRGFTTLFDNMKAEMLELQKLFFNVTKDENGKMNVTLNEDTVMAFESVAWYVQDIYHNLKLMVTDNLPAIEAFGKSVLTLFKSIYDNIGLISAALMLMFLNTSSPLVIITAIATALGKLPELIDFIANHIETLTIAYTTWSLVSSGAVGGAITLLGRLVLGLTATTGSVAALETAFVGATAATTVFGTTAVTEAAAAGTGIAAVSAETTILGESFALLSTRITTLFTAMQTVALEVIASITTALRVGLYAAFDAILVMISTMGRAFLGLEAGGVASFGAISFAALGTLGIIGAVVYGIWQLVDALRAARNTAMQVRNEAANDAGTGQIPDFGNEGGGEESETDDYNKHELMRNYRFVEKKKDYDREQLTAKSSRLTVDPPSEKPSKSAAAAADKAAREERQRAMQEIDTALKLEKDKIKATLEANDANFADNLISIEEYYRDKVALTKQGLEAEKSALEQKAAVETDASNLEKLNGQIDVLNQQISTESYATKILRDKTKAYKDLNKELETYNQSILTGEGNEVEAALSKYDAEHKNILDKLNAEVSGYGRIAESGQQLTDEQVKQLNLDKRILDFIKQQRDYTALEAKAAKELNAEKLKQSNIELNITKRKLENDAAHKRGLIDDVKYNEEAYKIENDAANAMKDNLNFYLAAQESRKAAINGNEKLDPTTKLQQLADIDKEIADYKTQILSLEKPLDYIHQTIKDDLVDGLKDGITDLIMQTKTVSESFRSMATSILNSIAKIAAQRWSSSIANALMSVFGGSSSGISGLSSGKISMLSEARGYSSGGETDGEGTETSDSIPALLSRKEFIFRAWAAKNIGLDNLNFMNKYGRLPPLKFAAGGSVGSSSGSSSVGAGTSVGITSLKINVINESGTPVQAKASDVSFNGVEQVMTLWLTGINGNVSGSKDILKNLAASR
jgi:hypothetical protein